MFWRKKQVVTTPAETVPAATSAETKPVEAKGEPATIEKLAGPKIIPELMGKYLIEKKDREPNWVWRLKVVVRKSPKGEQAFDIRIFDESETIVNKIKVEDYTSLDKHPELIHYEGWFDKQSKKVELEEKRVVPRVTILTKNEIQQKIEALTEPGSTVFFYLSASPASGGPLGRGAALVELNPKYPGKGQKKYILYAAPVEDVEPVGKGLRMFDSDKAKDIAGWISERHQRPVGY